MLRTLQGQRTTSCKLTLWGKYTFYGNVTDCLSATKQLLLWCLPFIPLNVTKQLYSEGPERHSIHLNNDQQREERERGKKHNRQGPVMNVTDDLLYLMQAGEAMQKKCHSCFVNLNLNDNFRLLIHVDFPQMCKIIIWLINLGPRDV